MSGQIFEYSPPEWAKVLGSIPKEYVSLAALPTITHELSYNGRVLIGSKQVIFWRPVKLTPGMKNRASYLQR